jgi:signal transduction histidine kinase/CheY-like chemotaxis protein
LRESERILKTTQRRAKIGGWEWDVTAKKMSWTEETYRIHDFDLERFDLNSPGHIDKIWECYDPKDRSLLMAAFRRCAEQGEPYDFEFPFTSAKGRRLCIRTTAEAVRVDGLVTKVVGNVMDITGRKLAEKQLTESHDLLSNLARLVPGVIYQYRLYPDGRSAFPYASPGMNDIYEVTPEEVREDATPVFGRLHPEDHQRVADAIRESARTLQTFYCEFRVVLPLQGLRWRWSQAHPERMADGGTLWHGIILDVTDRKRTEEEKEKLQSQLIQAQKMESVGRLAGGVAHDYNNMLSVILGYTQLAMTKLDSKNSLHQDLETVLNAAKRSVDITRQLLAFSRQQTIAPRTLDLNETVESMLKMLRRLIGEDIGLFWQPGADLWPVCIDPSQLDQILVNLCVNARDAIADVGKIFIETDTKVFDEDYCANHVGFVSGQFVLLSVSDNGCGMDKETQAHLFEPFFTTKEMGKGTGLGLATVYGIVRQNNGFINIYSEPNQGTTFKIYLPRHAAAVEPERKKDPALSEARGSETILVVEDEQTILKMTAVILEQMGYAVLTARSPGEAISLAREFAGEINLLITDVVMPDMNGRELAEQIKALYPYTKVLFMSGYTANVIAHRGVLYKGVNFIQKPFSITELATKVRGVLDEVDVSV